MNRIAIISDIHGNYPALKAVLKDIDSENIKEIYCLGDLVGYYCMINEVISLIREQKINTIMGNHDFALAYCNGIIAYSKTCTKILKKQIQYISNINLDYIKNLKKMVHFNFNEKNVYAVHGGLQNYLDEYLYEINNTYFSENNFSSDILITGNTHLPIIKKIENNYYLNPGSVGQPRDGDNRASYLILGANGPKIKRIPYNINMITSKMKEFGYESYLYEILYRGVKIGN